MLTLRLATPEDASGCVEVYRPFIEETAVSFELAVPSATEFARRITVTQETHPWIVACDGPTVAGYAYGCVHRARAAYRWSVEVSAYIGRNYRGSGLGRRLYTVLFDALRAQGFAHAFAGITLPNAASVRFHERFGFKPVGVFHRIGYKMETWHDVGWWERAISDDEPPVEPRPLCECRDEIAALVTASNG